MDKTYWKKYYNLYGTPDKPSFFAKFVLKNYLKKNESLIELGCGNGRDSIFLAKHNINVTAIDQCNIEISNLQKLTSPNNLKFICNDFTKLDNENKYHNIYSRFTLHSIPEAQEDRVIKWAKNNLEIGGKLFIEVRGKKNELYKLGVPVNGEEDAYIHDYHYRRFIDLNKLCEKLKDNNFTIILAEERSGFAPFKNTDHKFIRIVALIK